MALMKLRGELPKDAVYLSEDEALEHQWNMLWNWTPQREIFPLRYGYMAAGLFSSLAGVYFNNHYRVKLKLGSYGRLSTYIPIVVFPAIFTSLCHNQIVTNDILLQKTTCPLCVEMRAVAVQTLFGFVYPMVLSPLAGFTNASNYLTYDLPSLTQHPKQVLKVFFKMTKPISSKLPMIIAGQVLVASLITYQETKAFYNVQAKLIKQEQDALAFSKKDLP